MTTQFTKQIFSSTYKDDYADSDNYHRVLFNSGRALQARELTQLQTIIQSEIERLGRHLFKEGASINPGGVTCNNSYEFIKLNTVVNPLPTDPSELVGIPLTTGGGIIVEVIEAIAASGDDPATLFVKYLSTSQGTSGTRAIRAAAGEDLVGEGYILTIQTTDTVSNPAVGTGTKASIHAGDFWTQGHFVFAQEQSAIISKYTSTPTLDIGFKVIQQIVTTGDNGALFDNQGATPNLSSPGADRYQIKLIFTTRDALASDENFVHVAKIEDGVVVSQVSGIDDYNKINEVLALRTNEESGDYIAKKFTLKFDDNITDDSYLNFVVSPGTAYVQGYRANRDINSVIPVLKPRTTVTENNQVIAANYGNYILCNGNKGIPDINTIEEMDLRSDTTYGGASIGTARVRFVEEDDGNNYRLYLMQITMNTGQTFRDVRSIGKSVTNFWNLVLENNQAVLKEASNASLLFPLPAARPQSLGDISLTVQRRFITATDGSGNATIPLTATGENFADTNDWVTGPADDAVSNATVTGAGTQLATISGGPNNVASFEVLGYVNKSAGVVRSKTLVTTSETIAPDSSGNLVLSNSDIYEIVEIYEVDSASTFPDLVPRYDVDKGQRDNYYGLGKLTLKAGQTAPAGTNQVVIQYSYFQHGTAGDFFSVNSYTGQIDYADIPDHTLADGSVVNLRDFLDFRPSVNSSGNFGGGSKVNELPKNADLIQADISYYLSKACSVIIDTDGIVKVQESSESLSPIAPETPNNALELYRVNMNPYLVSTTDLSIKAIDSKRFTMADIGRLEKRIDSLEEVTALNLLELNTTTLDVLDSAGVNRTKSGFFVDNFVDQSRSATWSSDHKASIDPSAKIMRPKFVENQVRYIYDSDQSTNVVKKGDNIYLAHDETTWLDQPLASSAENINPFAVVTNRGWLEITPSSDEWREVRYQADRIIDGGLRIDTEQATLWNNWAWNWTGNETTGTQVGSQTTSSAGGGGTTTTTTVQRVVADETIREVVDDRLVDVALIPFMRARKISFRAIGLRPNTRHFAFFDDVNVASWIRSETFSRFSDDDTDYGSEFANITSHPQGSSELSSNAEGKIEGSFFLPSTSTLKFRAGQSEFKLLDVTVSDEREATSIASTSYLAQGVLERRQRDVLSTRWLRVGTSSTSSFIANPTPARRPSGGSGNPAFPPPATVSPGGPPGTGTSPSKDPLAQTFMVDTGTGIFVTKIGIYFATKATVAPVVCQIRPVVNGAPASNEFVPGATTFLSPVDVEISNNASVKTFFTFDEPVYLNGGTEYAIVLLTDSTDYNVYIAETYEFLIGSTEKRVNRQPTLGSLFKSQNSRIWEPDQTKDLTFSIERANFTATEGEVILENAKAPGRQLVDNPFITAQGDPYIEVYHPEHGFVVGDEVTISGSTDIGGIPHANINGPRTVAAVDGLGYVFTASSNATSSVFGGGTQVSASQNVMFDVAVPYIENIIPTFTAVNYESKFMSGSSLAGAELEYIKDVNYTTLFNKSNNYFNSPRLLGTAANESANLATGVKSITTKVGLVSANEYVSPVIDMQRASISLISNQIDNQSSVAGTGVNANVPLNYVEETNAANGSHLAKHLTQPVTLAETAVGLKVLLSANRPSVADFDVYYRTNSVSELLVSDWTLATKETAIPSDENTEIFRDYRYLIGGQNGTLDSFDQFQIKIVMRTTNSSKVPTFKDLRAIAMSV
jgi:hypothetical protein